MAPTTTPSQPQAREDSLFYLSPAQHRRRRFAVYGGLALMLLFLFFPLFWMISTSLKTPEQAFAIPPYWIPNPPTADNFVALADETFATYFLNSTLVASLTTVVTVIVSSLSAYSFTRLDGYAAKSLFFLILSTQMFPLALLLIPIYLMVRDLGLFNTYWALILANLAFALPFCVYFLRSYFETIPRELEDAAMIDGCNRARVLWHVIVPLARPGVLAAAFFTFMLAWDEFLMALTLVNRNTYRTLPPGLIMSYVGEFGFQWTEMMAAALVVILPIILVFAFFSRHLVQGLTEGAFK